MEDTRLRLLVALLTLSWWSSPVYSQTSVNIPDPNLETVIRETLNKSTGPLTSDDLAALTYLQASGRGITNLSGLEWATNLTSLDISSNTATDLRPLSGLINLQVLDRQASPGCDYTPLSGLAGLRWLNLGEAGLTNLNWASGLGLVAFSAPHNQISDIAPVSTMGELNQINLDYNPLTNTSVLGLLTNLQMLSVGYDHISDFGFLVNMTNLTDLYIFGNLATNIDMLLTLTNLRVVDLRFNLLDLSSGSPSADLIQGLQTRCTVYFQPQWQPPQIQLQPQWFIPANQPSYLTFWAVDSSTEVDRLSVCASSSNPGLLSDTNISINWWMFGWSLAVNPTTNHTGNATVTVTITDSVGLSSAQTIQLQVTNAQPLDGHALNCTNVVWETSGTMPFFSQTNVTEDGLVAAQSGGPGSWLETAVTGPGVLAFWYLGQSALYSHSLEFTATCASSNLSSHLLIGDVAWTQVTINIPPGYWTLRWEPTLDDYPNSGWSTCWIANVTFTPGMTYPWLSNPVQGGPDDFRILLNGDIGATYEIQTSTDLTHWASIATRTFYAPMIPFQDQSLAPAVRFYRLHKIAP